MRRPPPEEWLEDAEQTVDDMIELARTDPIYPPWVRQRNWRFTPAEHGLPVHLCDTLYWFLLRHDPNRFTQNVTYLELNAFERPRWMTPALHAAIGAAVDFSVGYATIWFRPERLHRTTRVLESASRKRRATASGQSSKKRQQGDEAMTTHSGRYRHAEAVLPPDLYEAARSRLPAKSVVYLRPIGHEMNRGERVLGAALVRKLRQALCLHRTGVNLYFGSQTPVGRPRNNLRAHVNFLLREEWPPRVIQDALGISRSVLAKTREPSSGPLKTVDTPQRFSLELLQTIGTPSRNDIAEVVAMLLLVQRQHPTGDLATDVERLKLSVFGDKVSSDEAVDALMVRVAYAAQARCRLRQAGLRPPNIPTSLIPATPEET